MRSAYYKGFAITETVYLQDGNIYSVDILAVGRLKDYNELLYYIDAMQANYTPQYTIEETENGFICYDARLGYMAVEVEVTEHQYLDYDI